MTLDCMKTYLHAGDCFNVYDVHTGKSFNARVLTRFEENGLKAVRFKRTLHGSEGVATFDPVARRWEFERYEIG